MFVDMFVYISPSYILHLLTIQTHNKKLHRKHVINDTACKADLNETRIYEKVTVGGMTFCSRNLLHNNSERQTLFEN